MDTLYPEALRIAKSLPETLVYQLRDKYQADCKRLALPSPRRVFLDLAPEVYSVINELRKHPDNTKSLDYPLRVFNWILGETKASRCLTCQCKMLRPEYCSQSCASRDIANRPEVKRKKVKTCLKRYGTRNPAQASIAKAKFQETASKRTEEFHKARLVKYEATMQERYGVSNAMETIEMNNLSKLWMKDADKFENSISKRRLTNLNRYGSSVFPNSLAGRKVCRQSCLAKYGVPNPQQDPEVRARTLLGTHRKHVVQLGESKLVLQGYEPYVAKSLYRQGHKVEAKVKAIPYRLNGKRRFYHPDLLIDDKFVAEVKSEYTLTSAWKMNLAKFRAANRWCRENEKVFIVYVLSAPTSEGLRKAVSIPFPTSVKLRRASVQL